MSAKYSLLHKPNLRQYLEMQGSGRVVLLVVICLVNIFLGYSLKSLTTATPSCESDSMAAQLGIRTVEKTFIYHKDLADHPTNNSNHAWDLMFPSQGGYFTHPTISPQRGVFSGFHTLHCLNSIRKGYWKVYDIAQTGKPEDVEKLPIMMGPPHVRHCIDLIRQNLMCQPDLTVEIKDDESGGVHGFGTTHKCVDWDQLNEWLSEWEKRGLDD